MSKAAYTHWIHEHIGISTHIASVPEAPAELYPLVSLAAPSLPFFIKTFGS